MKSTLRRKFLSKEGINRIVGAIRATEALDALTWADIQRLASEHAGGGYVWTRQALERRSEIKEAYRLHETSRKKLLKGSIKGARLSESEKVSRLELEVSSLRARLDKYDERFATYLANAISHGLTVEQLSKPLTPPNRGSGNSDKS